jgi:hypothetical protein
MLLEPVERRMDTLMILDPINIIQNSDLTASKEAGLEPSVSKEVHGEVINELNQLTSNSPHTDLVGGISS